MHRYLLPALALSLAASLAVGGARAADPSEAGRTLPPICRSGGNSMAAGNATSSGGGMNMDMGPTDRAHQDLMAGMGAMNANMDAGMRAKDIDVAFVCGMIPHHQGAIDMAKAELSHGKDPFARKLAQSIVAAQEKEIAEMLDWLKKQPQ